MNHLPFLEVVHSTHCIRLFTNASLYHRCNTAS